MNEKFILLTTVDNNPVIIGLSNIASIETDNPKKVNSGTRITLNFARGSDIYPKTIFVTETFVQIKNMLEL
jgi:hypothetical protein